MSTVTKDPTAQQAAGNAQGLTPQQKIEGLQEIVKQVGNAMLTSRSPDGKLASRAMHPATTEGLVFSFYQNSDSGKTDDIESDPNVNVSFIDPKTGDWVSVSGKAVINKDQSKIKRHWSQTLQAWFDDKKDGVHTGKEDDPRVCLLDVHPEEIRYFATSGRLAFLKDVAKATFSGGVASPGQLVIVTNDEIQLASKVHKQQT
ncbi:hypothetical protein BDZ90DRAFT_231040 [Jaminaea rosea]|uniref:General stress protein FMN-binding split barrel domain-containing protein n=1 Tax=Jaminaea rosea TaxID=1569628 RepID=A0A316UUS8_9BASI|nr:hypothetical protein BDZ90DRAFT_231040 [Jaminaea rosea]PWN29039.1 hypothetical protein BDZ90DRAFT_231040 [Jaminaea rosea]